MIRLNESILQIEKPFDMSVKDIFLYILTNYSGMFFKIPVILIPQV